jgi:hypothetical protein
MQLFIGYIRIRIRIITFRYSHYAVISRIRIVITFVECDYYSLFVYQVMSMPISIICRYFRSTKPFSWLVWEQVIRI